MTLEPKNTKSIFNVLGNEMALLQNEVKISSERSLAIAKIAQTMINVKVTNLNEYKARRTLGESDFKMKDVEKEFD